MRISPGGSLGQKNFAFFEVLSELIRKISVGPVGILMLLYIEKLKKLFILAKCL